MNIALLVTGWHQSGKTAFLNGRVHSPEKEIKISSIKVSEDISSFKNLKDLIEKSSREFDLVKVVYVIRDPRVCWGLSIDRMHRLNNIKTTGQFINSVRVAEKEIQRLIVLNIADINVIRFRDYIENKDLIREIFDNPINIKNDSAEKISDKALFTKIDKEIYLPFLAYFYNYDSAKLIELELNNIMKKYDFNNNIEDIVDHAKTLVTSETFDNAIYELKKRLIRSNYDPLQ